PPLSPTPAIARLGDNATISCPPTSTGFTLEASASLGTGGWTAVPGVANNAVTLPAGAGSQFFRLRQ
ncbi:MAG: hypothetical protein ACKO3N_02485, partial [Verrucomicrobiota bacterium]